MAYDNTNRGALFKNNNRRNNGDPEYTGYIHFGLDKHQIIASMRTSKPTSKNPNQPFFAISFKDEAAEHDDFESPNQTGGGVLFRNESKDKESHPDYRGSIDKGGKSYWLSAWLKESGENSQNPGMKFLSLSVTEKEERNDTGLSHDELAAKVKASNQASIDDIDDDIPF